MLQGKVPSDEISKRQQYINSMKKFIEEQKAMLHSALDQLGLQLLQLLEADRKQVCPYNSNHVVPEKTFKKHTETCRLLSAGCQKDELEVQLQDLDFAYKDSDHIMKVEIDEKTLNEVIWDNCVQNGQVYTGHRQMPRSHIEENIHLTQEDRLALYQYVVQKSHEAGKVLPVDRFDDLLTTDWGSLVKKGLLDEQNSQEYGSKLEQLAALRDMKRRRQSYRAKNVHITKKSYTEIIREVILNQMEILAPGKHRKSTGVDKQSTPDARESRSDWSRGDSVTRPSKYDREKRSRRDERDDRRHKRSRRSRSRDKQLREDGSSSYVESVPSACVDEPLPSVVKVEADVERKPKVNPHTSEADRDTGSAMGSYHRSRKRSVSSSGDESSDGREKKSKKSKHKRKRSKKHKRREK
ncbi:U11/u12 small nuclear ribonucleoprotein 48 kda protein [Plakobranchus ocellatus]|uniref:U11/u12 small nuclear ribonucleoprotein 48 kDa protein n=1 Tax=Plakobranchus ocellatus TaxID=259542 RepID=A0AAV3ZTK6_9GAST|nr:U11/u12 small nuclear ribonucleoprotein 48 kda protein [Plakobranchus ocellatus]